jgi:hypothetical protein
MLSPCNAFWHVNHELWTKVGGMANDALNRAHHTNTKTWFYAPSIATITKLMQLSLFVWNDYRNIFCPYFLFQKVGMSYLPKSTNSFSKIGWCKLHIHQVMPTMVSLILIIPWVTWLATFYMCYILIIEILLMYICVKCKCISP